MESRRPAPVGAYELLTDFESADMSIRILKLAGAAASVRPHRHARSAQVYVALEGTSVVEVEGVESVLTPFTALEVPRGALHTASPAGGTSLLMNISTPPLSADDQQPA